MALVILCGLSARADESAVLSKNANSTPADSTESYAGKLGVAFESAVLL
jgi:hypothetical protein